MGMGHAVYKTFDPRGKILKEMSRRLTPKAGHPKWYEYLVRIEEEGIKEFTARGKTGISTNVDFYSGSVYASMGIPIDIMTPVFAISRISGWWRTLSRKNSPKPRISLLSTGRKPNMSETIAERWGAHTNP